MNRRTTRGALRVALALTATGAVVSGLAACSPSSSDESGGDKKLTVWTWTTPGEELEATIPGFQEDHPGVDIDVQDVGNPAIWDKITTGMAAGGEGLPDIMYIGIDYISNYLEKFPDGLANLSELGADELEADFSSAIWGSGQNKDGAQFGIPFEEYISVLSYRKDLFEQAGIDVNSLETWDDFIAAGVTLKEKTGVSLLAVDKSATVLDASGLWQFLTIPQGSFFFDQKGDISLNSAEAVRSLEILKELNDKGLIADIPGSIDKALAAFNEGKIATIPGASWVPGALPDAAPDAAGMVGLTPMPAVEPGGQRGSFVGGGYATISNASKNKDLAWDFVKYAYATEEAQAAQYDAGGLFPSYIPFQTSDEFVNQPSEYFNGESPNVLFTEMLGEFGETTINYTSDYPQALKLYDDAQTQVLVSGADPQKALDDAAKQLASQTGRKIASN